MCAPAREYWRTRLAPEAKSSWSNWLIHELEQMLRDDVFGGTLCPDYLHGHLSTIKRSVTFTPSMSKYSWLTGFLDNLGSDYIHLFSNTERQSLLDIHNAVDAAR
ncbi:hypothetical protein B0H10DRAFT_2207626 [Mycena sp. CBHHK59/15]|nr:hypothetical protein B0H10DRAFT_2212645 [Mycena sp. CBHHK59/15]KAJ6630539.1 hypothetical protein B0H10DRAFT_2207626 [Mycena sp. CBHHK59/15]